MQNKDVLFIHDNGYRSHTEGLWKAVHKPTGANTGYYQNKALALSVLKQMVEPVDDTDFSGELDIPSDYPSDYASDYNDLCNF